MQPALTGLLRRLRQVAPWLVAAALIAYLLLRIPRHQLMTALLQAHLGYLGLVVLFVVFGSLVADSWATARVFTWFLTPVRLRDLLPVRASTYLMAILNYHLGQAGLVYYVHRQHGVSIAAATSMMLMAMGTVLLVLGGMSVVGVVLHPDQHTWQLRWVLAGLGASTLVYLVVIWRRPWWLTRRPLLAPLFSAGVAGHLKATLIRVPHMLVVVSTHFLAMRCFEIPVPLSQGLVHIPIMLLVATLPLTPFGLGTSQLAAVHLFSRYLPPPLPAARARVLAYSLSLVTLAVLTQTVLGLICLQTSLRGLYAETTDTGEQDQT